MSKELADDVFDFIEDLEMIRFMRNDSVHFQLVSEKIHELNDIINLAIK